MRRVKSVSPGGRGGTNSPSRTRTYDHSINRSSIHRGPLVLQREVENNLDVESKQPTPGLEGLTGGLVSEVCQELGSRLRHWWRIRRAVAAARRIPTRQLDAGELVVIGGMIRDRR